MKTFNIIPKTIPEVVFSHMHVTNNYNLSFKPRNDFIELTYFEHSAATYRTDDGNEISIPSNSVFVNDYQLPAVIYSAESQVHYTVAFHLEYDLAGEDDEKALHLERIITDSEFARKAAEIIKTCTKEILLSEGNNFEMSALVLKLFALYQQRHASISEQKNEKVNLATLRYVERAKDYILNHIREKFSVSDIADELMLSRGYLSNIFRAATGTTIVRYINEVRMQIVKSLVLNESATISEACAFVGINDPNYISRMFRKYMNTTITDIKEVTQRGR